jgi:hypothetical protein
VTPEQKLIQARLIAAARRRCATATAELTDSYRQLFDAEQQLLEVSQELFDRTDMRAKPLGTGH